MTGSQNRRIVRSNLHSKDSGFYRAFLVIWIWRTYLIGRVTIPM
jgi:hypothetical protein